MKKLLILFPSIILGALFIYSGLGYFFHFSGTVLNTADAIAFAKLMHNSGISSVVLVLEVIGGVLILVPSKRALGITLLAPIVVNIFLFQLCLNGNWEIGSALLVLSAIIAYQEREKFKALL